MSFRKELLSARRRKWDEILYDVSAVYVIPSGRKHDSGYACMDFVAVTKNGKVRFGGSCDDVKLDGNHFRIDCDYPSRIVHIWNYKKTFTILRDLSTIDFIE